MADNRFYLLLNEHYPYLAFASAVEFPAIVIQLHNGLIAVEA
ncbi:hypothetical protein [Jeotgalibacillus proteolyticus]|nr:hypothetical protein [Jeotgalibacillus proteolyticus]